jgi:predicted nucleic acid binding AN1-type Zn finger protein
MAFFILPINLISFILNYNNMDKSKQKRCSHEKCNKKLKLIVFDCKCGGSFCSEHRYTSSHNCPTLEDKKKSCREIIKGNNPEINFSKVIKI